MKKTLICLAVTAQITGVPATQAENAALSPRLESIVQNGRPLELSEKLGAALAAIDSKTDKVTQSGLLGSHLASERSTVVSTVAKSLVTVDVESAIAFGAAAAQTAPRLARDTFEALINAAPNEAAAIFQSFASAKPELSSAFLAIAAQAPVESLFAIADALSQMESGKDFRGQVLGDWIADRIDSKLDINDKRSRILDQLIVFQSKVRLVQERYEGFTAQTQKNLGANSFGNMAELIATQVIQVNLFDQGGEEIETAFLDPETLVAPAFVSEIPSNQAPPFAAGDSLQTIADQIFQTARTSQSLVNPNSAPTVSRPGRQLSKTPATTIIP